MRHGARVIDNVKFMQFDKKRQIAFNRFIFNKMHAKILTCSIGQEAAEQNQHYRYMSAEDSRIFPGCLFNDAENQRGGEYEQQCHEPPFVIKRSFH